MSGFKTFITVTALLAAIGFVAWAATPTKALAEGDPPVVAACDNLYDTIVAAFTEAGSPVQELSGDDLAEALTALSLDPAGVTRAFLAVASGGKVVLGLERNGCLEPPIVIAVAVPSRGSLSGATPFGTFA